MSYDIAKDSETQDPHFEQKQQSQNEVPRTPKLKLTRINYDEPRL
jgi:hypothetical protein